MKAVVDPQSFLLEEGPDMPNNPGLPVLLYPQALGDEVTDKAGAFEQRFRENGWGGTWRNGIMGHHHFHPDAHEALGIARGFVEVQLGGEAGKRFRLQAGDLVVLPAGIGHKNLSASDDLLVVGAYPRGQEDYTICRSKAEVTSMPDVPLPESDPFYGKEGPLTRIW
ncbi:cupin domain-containing protein [Chelativorans sp. AA-79]|uniref:cupin domain-containing protein n=1 Tax=Chelativorans sp. AA-79 TaxID=3028735 RepID=UPI0023F7AF0A|nr:cupin domain-containing protein [Chelativorans sp. AA-79]WEX10500.1 cupin domain-containing protein [Chelativorans sp. AA-79]